jgi:hypothetical protein
MKLGGIIFLLRYWRALPSLPPLSGYTNPKPLVALNYFTMPVATSALHFSNNGNNHER